MRSLAILLLSACALVAQPGPYLVTTVAGGSPVEIPPQGTTAAQLRILLPSGVAVDATGNIYLADNYYDRILRITPAGVVTTFAGTSTGFGGDGGPATEARFNGVEGLALNAAGDLFVCDRRNGRIRRITRAGIITTVVGNGVSNPTPDGRPATSGGGGNPRSVTLDAAGNLYYSDTLNHVVRKVDAAGVVTTVAGTLGRPGFSGDRGPATSAQLQGPSGLALDAQGNLFIADTANNRVRRVNAQGVIETLVGNGNGGETGDAGQATAAQINNPIDLALNSDGHLFIANRVGGRVRRVRNGIISTVAGGGTARQFPSQATLFSLALPNGIALTASGDLLLADEGRRQLYQVRIVGDSIQALAGLVGGEALGDGGPATQGKLLQPLNAAVDAEGTLYITDLIDNRVRRVGVNGTISTLAGSGALAISNGLGRAADLGRPRGITLDRNGNIFASTSWGATVRRITPAGNVTTFAGGASTGFAGDGGQALQARFFAPQGLAFDRQDNLYIADSANNRVRRIAPDGVVVTIAGTGERGFGGDGGPATLARLAAPVGVAVDDQGNVFVADSVNHRIRRIDRTGNITTVAGTGETGPCNAAVAAAQSTLWLPSAVALDAAGNLLIANTGFGQVCSLAANRLTLIAGVGSGFSGDGGPALEARFSSPQGLAVAPDGSIYVVDTANERVRKLTLARLASTVVSHATRAAGPVAPYQLVIIQGLGLGPATAVTAEPDAEGKYPKSLAGVQALFGGAPAALLSVQERVVVAAVPATIGESVPLRIEYQGRPTNELTLVGAPAAPGVYAGVKNEDGADNGESAPAPVGSTISFTVTGLGAVDPALDDGATAAEEQEVKPVQPVEVTLGGLPAELISARVAARQLPGVITLRVKVPEGLEAGAAALLVKVGAAESQAGLSVTVSPAP